MRHHQLSSLGCVYGLHGFRLDHSCISTSYYRTERIIMEEIGASLWGWAINVTYSVKPADSTVDSKPWVHSSNTSELSVTVAITTLLARKKNLEKELTYLCKQILPGFLSTETIFLHHGIWDFPTLNNRNKSETNDPVNSYKAQWRQWSTSNSFRASCFTFITYLNSIC